MDRQPIGNLFASRVLELLGTAGKPAGPKPHPAPAAPKPLPSPARRDQPASGPGSVTLSPTARRIVDVLEGAHPVSLTFKAATLRAGASPRLSQFRAYQREVIGSGLVDVSGDRLTARRADPTKWGGNPLQAYFEKLQPSWASMLQKIAMSSIPLTRDEIADRSGVSRKSSGLGQGLREQLAMELIERATGERYALNEALRPILKATTR